MELRLRDLAPIDPLGVPLPSGEEAARRWLAGAPGPLGRGAPRCPEVSFEEDGDA
jgi:hypothetical protein